MDRLGGGMFFERKYLAGLALLVGAANAAGLEGTYVYSCINSSYGGAHDRIMTFQPNGGYSEIERRYAGSTCSSSLLVSQTVRSGSFVVGGPYGNGTELDITISQIQHKPLTAQTAAALNASAYCGFSNWQNNAYKNLTQLNCDGEVVQTGTIYTLFGLSGDESEFYGGAHVPGEQGESAQTRPTELLQ